MEIKISNGIVRRVFGGQNAPMTPQAIQARTIANFLPWQCQRISTSIVHNTDDGYTGIRFDTRVGAVVLEMPTTDGWYRLVHSQETGEQGRDERLILRFPPIYKPSGIALQAAEFLRTRGFLG